VSQAQPSPLLGPRALKAFKAGIRAAVVFGLVLATAFSAWPRTPKPAFYFEVTMRSSLTGIAQLFYDTGSGIREIDSVRLQAEGGNRDVAYKFPLPSGTYSFLRFDPTDRPGNVMVLSGLRIVTAADQLVRAIEPNQVKAAQQIEHLEQGPARVSLISASSAADPILKIELEDPLSLKSFARDSWRTFARRFLLSFLVASVIGLLVAPALRLEEVRATAIRWTSNLRAWSIAHPQQAVLMVAALSVILSCYPVIFFNKSFVSPNNHSHTYLLYGHMPTVPGYKEVETDDEKGADLGAAMWQNWPYSVVEGRGLLEHGELPLWNRYNSCGLPLLGQGLSMCADPLQLLVLFTKGSSVAWDLRYLLAKLLFASCLGLCVLQAARHLPAALLVAATAPFIGFFSYRYAHPVFFTLCYAPSILLCWFKLLDARPGRDMAVWLAAMVLADWTLLNSGAVKESYLLLLALNSCGFLTLLLGRSGPNGKGTKLFQAAFAKVLFLAIAMPIWLTFFHALKNSLTAYDIGGAWQLQPNLLIGLFDDIFYRQFNTGETHLDPSLNFLVLVGVFWFFLRGGRADERGLTRGLSITCLLALLFVFGIIPPSWIVRLPFLRNVFHIDNSFSCIAIVCLLVLAGFGLKAFWSDCQADAFKRTYLRVLVALAVLNALYFGATQAAQRSSITLLHLGEHVPRSNFFWGYSLSLMLAVAVTPWLARQMIMTSRARAWQIFLLALLFVLFHWRHGMHLTTPFDAYVMNPQRRVNLVADSSPALALIKGRATEPSRTAGLDSAFFPGYGGAVGIEQIDGPDPLLNKHYRALMDAWGIKLLFGSWRFEISPARLGADLPLFNMLNVGYFLGDEGVKNSSVPSLSKIASLDLDIFASERVWPRAFFTDRLVTYGREEEFIDLLKKSDGAPLAGIPKEALDNQTELARFIAVPTPPGNRKATPATNYAFTNNTTSFKVNATGPGVIVLTEAYVPDDFQVRVNGNSAKYFRVNSAFKGLFVPDAGDYVVSFAYWPRYFTLSLWIAAAACAIFLGWVTFLVRMKISHGAGNAT
jgi:hypothetical protein